jgi:hypothetical protein
MAKLLVFLHLSVKQRALQGELQAALPRLTVTAVGRVADFDRALSQGQDAVLAAGPVLEARAFVPRLQGYRLGQRDEAYALVAAGRTPDPAQTATVGALDLLGREGTAAFVHNLLGSEPKVERVTKVEDLLPLLQIERADTILLATRLVPELQQASQMKLVARELDKRVTLPGVAVLNPQGAEATRDVQKLPQAISKSLGVDEWR